MRLTKDFRCLLEPVEVSVGLVESPPPLVSLVGQGADGIDSRLHTWRPRASFKST